MNGSGKVLQQTPNSHSEVEIEQVNIVEFGNVMDMMTLEPHSEKQGFKDGGKNIRII